MGGGRRTHHLRRTRCRSRLLAGRLAEAGVATEDVVALVLPRSVDLIVAMIAVVRAGAAYLPLDSTPASRSPRHADRPGRGSTDPARRRLRRRRSFARDRIPTGRPDLDRCGPLDVAVRDDQAAYVIYTSGSTGRPKA
ncbi:AMP-binding protein [Rhodococcus hoagii]|nr:AMP-binding protein [Prescottella equi]